MSFVGYKITKNILYNLWLYRRIAFRWLTFMIFCANDMFVSLLLCSKGEIGSFDSLLRVLRTLGKLNVFQPLVDEEQLVHTKNQALAINRRCFFISIHSFNACRSITSACRGSPSADRSIASAAKSIAFTFSSEKCLISIKSLPLREI